MTDESDSSPFNSRKRNIRCLEDSPSTSSDSNESLVVTTSRRVRRLIEDDSDSDSGSSIEVLSKKKRIARVISDGEESNSSDSTIFIRKKRPPRLMSDSDSSGDESASSHWETDVSDNEGTKSNTAKLPDTGVDTDSSDGQSEKCPICLRSFTNQDIGTPETCDHMFCAECIQEWSKNMNTCPVDRQEYHLIFIRNKDLKILRQVSVEPVNQQNDEVAEDTTCCEICGSSGREDRMLLCDGCDLGFHLDCLTPPLLEVPRGSWYCNECNFRDVMTIEIYAVTFSENYDGQAQRTRRRQTTSPRLVPRTTQNERVRRRIANNRLQSEQLQGELPQAVSSTTTRRRNKRKKKKKSRYKVVYQVDEVTGETIAVKKRKKGRKKKRRRERATQPPRTVKGRLASQLGICPPRAVPQNLPDVRIPTQTNTIQMQRYQAGIPTLHLFGQRDDLGYFSPLDEDDEVDGSGILTRRASSRPDIAALRRTRAKAINLPNSVSSSTDILGSILDSQAKFHSKNATLSVGKGGKILVEESKDKRVKFDNYNQFLRQRPSNNSNNTSDDSVPSSSGSSSNTYQSSASSDNNSYVPTSTVTNSSTSILGGGSNEEQHVNYNYTNRIPCSSNDINSQESKKEKKKTDDLSENNTPRSQTPCSGGESEIDIYSDIETVSTSKADEADYRVSSPPMDMQQTPNAASDEDNDSEPDMVIDTEKPNPEPEENTKEETTVTSTVDSNTEMPVTTQTVTSTSELQSEAVQSSNQLFDDKIKDQEEDEDSEDECPNFSIYSKESITLAKNTEISLEVPTQMEDVEQNNQVGEVSSSPSVHIDLPENNPSVGNSEPEGPVERTCKPFSSSSGLYSDSEDETVVKKDVQSSFGISDIRNMTEDISEEERSYTPCLDERSTNLRQGLDGLDTEMISDEDRNDFDETHDLKTASDGGDALEINAKECELDFTRPEDYEEGEIVDKSKNKKEEDPKKGKNDVKKTPKKKDENDKSGNKENETQNNKDSAFKKLSKNNKERNYREKDRDRSKTPEKKDKSEKELKKDKKKEKRKEIERYDVRAIIAEKPRRLKDKFGRDIRRSTSNSRSRSPTPRRSLSRNRRSVSRTRRSTSRARRSLSRGRRSTSKDRNRKKRRRSRRRSLSRTRSRSFERKRSRSRNKKRKRSASREKRRKSRDRSKNKLKKQKSRSRHRSRSLTPKRNKEWPRRRSRDWSPSLSRSKSPDPRRLTPSWTPPRMMDNSVKPHNLTVILTNDNNKKKKEKKKKTDKKAKESERPKKRKRSDRTPPPSKEVFASGDNILVSVSFNKENETRDVSTAKRRKENEEATKKARKEKRVKTRKKVKDLTGIKPVAIIDLERSPFKEITPSPKDVIVLTDSDNEEGGNIEKNICDSSQQVATPERCLNNYSTGPKTPPEPQVKFTLTSKQPQLRNISNPLREPDDMEGEGDTQEVMDNIHKGPNTPPEPPNSPPSSPDAYDPFEPTKSRSPTPEPLQPTQSSTTLHLDDNREDGIMDSRSGMSEMEKSNSISQTPDVSKSHTPPLADIQPADSQSSIHATPESSLGKSPEHSSSSLISQPVQTPAIAVTKSIPQTIPFSSTSTTVITSTPVNSNLPPPRINILNSTIITPPSVPQRLALPNIVKSSPAKISPTKPVVKSTPSKPMPSKTTSKPIKKSNGRSQNSSDSVDIGLSLDSPYSPGSSDYEDLFEPPVETAVKPPSKPAPKNTKSPSKIQSTFDALFGSPFNKIKPKVDNKSNKFNKKPLPVPTKTKTVGVKLDEDNLKILDELPNSAVEMQVKDKFLKKLNRQERVVEEVKLVLKPHYNKKHVNKEEYKDILRRAVPKICHNKSGEINPTKIKNLIEAYVKKVRHSKKVTSSSSVNLQKA